MNSSENQFQKVIEFLNKERQKKKRAFPMTIAAAAICREKPPGEEERDIVMLVADRMYQSGDIEYEPDRPKISELTPKVACLFAGDRVLHNMVASATKQEAARTGVKTVAEAAELYAFHFLQLRNKRTQNRYLSQTPFDLDAFFSRQNEFKPEWFQEKSNGISAERLGVMAIIAGQDEGTREAHIYTVGIEEEGGWESTLPKCHDEDGFVAVGTGQRQFSEQLKMIGYARNVGNIYALLVMCLAKKRAEHSPFVGAFTDVAFVSEKLQWFLLPALEAIRKYSEEFENAVTEARNALVFRMAKDPVIGFQDVYKEERPID